jgi:hypothetical protein
MKMISKKIFYRSISIIAGIGIIIILFLSLTHNMESDKINYRVIRVDKGWGYELFNGGKIIIHQEIIPVIEGENPFLSRKDARKTGKLALQKLCDGRIPLITRQDLDSLQIIYPETLHY